ncbi:hypothetical protein FNH22_24715 [Fulvivirga sp. M361]|uniref:tail fiber protein n=1 Tax=Fulvivirga sp. M361 TaxID=2594266 RepID=UPI00117B6838|nr:tail fiber protein [Fulvivirga sp. M361]TRX51198.1 hypothetical protein FNH22_24715 [Fulvivirga sp. M361]
MKKIILSTAILFPTLLWAQYDINGDYKISGNVGIGTNQPETKLEVTGFGVDPNALKLSSFDSQTNTISMVFHPRKNYLPNPASSIKGILDYGLANEEAGSISFNTSNSGQLTEKMRIRYDGNIGIGTNQPETKLEVTGFGVDPNVLKLSSFDSQTNTISMVFHPRKNYLPNPASSIKGILDYGLANEEAGSISFSTSNSGQLTEKMRIRYDGNVGIGTMTPDSKLTVAGNVHSREVKVTIDAGADFVFDSSYNLRSLEETEKFIGQNKHLPEIASEKEMKKNGLLVGEMNIKLLQKIEELTLYLIKQNKEIKELKRKVQSLENE